MIIVIYLNLICFIQTSLEDGKKLIIPVFRNKLSSTNYKY